MTIEVHALLHNEAKMLPYFVRHYRTFADNIIFYESNSTDGSPEIAEKLGCIVLEIPGNNNQINERLFCSIKNNCWKSSEADWVFIGDLDEFAYHPNIKKILQETEYNAFWPKEIHMMAREFPTTEGQIYDEVKAGFEGSPGYNKLNLFKPKAFKEINYGPGCHACSPVGNIRLAPETDIVTLHFHWIGLEYRIERNKYVASRISDENKKYGWGVHNMLPEETMRQNFEESWAKCRKIF